MIFSLLIAFASIHQLLNATDRRPPWETNSSPPVKEIPRILSEPKVRYRFHNSRSRVHILSQINLVRAPFPSLKIHFHMIFPCVLKPKKWFLSFGFPHQNPVWISVPSQTYHVSLQSDPLPCGLVRVFSEEYTDWCIVMDFIHSPLLLHKRRNIYIGGIAQSLKWSRYRLHGHRIVAGCPEGAPSPSLFQRSRLAVGSIQHPI